MYTLPTSTRSPRQKEAADKLSIIFPLFLRTAEPTLFLDIYFLGCVLLELIKMTISRTESRSGLYQAPKERKKKKKAAVGHHDIEVSSSKGFHMLILLGAEAFTSLQQYHLQTITTPFQYTLVQSVYIHKGGRVGVSRQVLAKKGQKVRFSNAKGRPGSNAYLF